LTWLEICIPLSLFFISFLLKLVVGRDPDLPEIIRHFIELPCDIAFIALSFIAASIVYNSHFGTENLFIVIIVISIIILTLFFRAKSVKSFDKKKIIPLLFLLLINYLLSIATIYGIICYIIERRSQS